MRQGRFQCWLTADNWLKLLDKVLLGVGLGSLFQDSNVYFSLQVFRFQVPIFHALNHPQASHIYTTINSIKTC